MKRTSMLSLGGAVSTLLLLVTVLATPARAEDIPSLDEPIVLRDWLVLPHVGKGGRRAFPHDRITHALVTGTFEAPKAGDTVALDGAMQAVWTAVTGPKQGPLASDILRGGWAFTTVHVAAPRRAILRAKGHGTVYVNGVPRVGNVYRYTYPMIPVFLHAGDNTFLVRCTGRGTIEASLEGVTHDVMVNLADTLLPEAVRGETKALDAGILLLNTTNETLLWKLEGERIQPATLEVAVVEPGAYRKVTFRSKVEGSVQYFGYRPPRPPHDDTPHALMLHLHGASDEATTYRKLYYAKTWCAMASATNRRPYGFDWEGLGRIDAMEVLEHAIALGNTDRTRIYLGGHSMGGHGVWQIGGHYPDRFAAIGPGAGWQDFWSYGGAPTLPADGTPIERVLHTAANPSRTALLVHNYLQQGVLIIHGDADPVVPIEEAHAMKALLEAAGHHDVQMVVQPGGVHVYDATPEVGHSCFDLRELFDFFQHHVIPTAPQRIDFTTIGPGINDTCAWLEVQQQVRQWAPSRVEIQLDPGRRVLHGTLENVRRFAIDPSVLINAGAFIANLDGEEDLAIDWTSGPVHFLKTEGGWRQAPAAPLSEKGPHRAGPFKDVFQGHHPILVVGTQGTEQENAWALAKARYDSETLWYRGNATLEIVLDTAFDPWGDPERNVVLYGNRDTNAAWATLLGTSPVDIFRGRIQVGERTFEGEGLAALVIRPRPGSDVACVGLVGGTDLSGMRATDTLGFFFAGVHFPDFTVFSDEVWQTSEKGVLAAGFFDNDWGLDETQTGFAE